MTRLCDSFTFNSRRAAAAKMRTLSASVLIMCLLGGCKSVQSTGDYPAVPKPGICNTGLVEPSPYSCSQLFSSQHVVTSSSGSRTFQRTENGFPGSFEQHYEPLDSSYSGDTGAVRGVERLTKS